MLYINKDIKKNTHTHIYIFMCNLRKLDHIPSYTMITICIQPVFILKCGSFM